MIRTSDCSNGFIVLLKLLQSHGCDGFAKATPRRRRA
jgi:hypothetical protein